ncbi:hypothetical protein M3Y94_00146800 [Aphelenchoides besseyi]|nr:hypothetical protein M3Y94_00146800 [Aphelenchoides besseyi]
MKLTWPHCHCSLVCISDDQLLLYGGFNTVERVITTEIFKLGSEKSRKEIRLFKSDSGLALIDEIVYMAGDYDVVNLHNTVEVHKPEGNKWILLETKMLTRRLASSVVACRGVLVVAAGLKK